MKERLMSHPLKWLMAGLCVMGLFLGVAIGVVFALVAFGGEPRISDVTVREVSESLCSDSLRAQDCIRWMQACIQVDLQRTKDPVLDDSAERCVETLPEDLWPS